MKRKLLNKVVNEDLNRIINERGYDGGLPTKVYQKYKNVIDKLVASISREFNLHPTLISSILSSAIDKKYGHKFRPTVENNQKGKK